THTGAKGCHDVPRNLSDAAIDAVAATGGVIGLIFAPIFLAGRLRATTEGLLDHLDYIVGRVGVEHVALGSDYDGWLPSILSDHRDCRDIHRVLEGLERRGYSADDIAGISGQNALRAFARVAAAREA